MAGDAQPRAPTDKEAFFFLNILNCMKNTPDVDWEHVAQLSGYSNAACAKTRFGQIKKAIGYTAQAGSGSAATTPVKSRGKKEIGSGTNKTPSKVSKHTTPRKTKAKAEVSEGELQVKKQDDTDGADVKYHSAGDLDNDDFDDY